MVLDSLNPDSDQAPTSHAATVTLPLPLTLCAICACHQVRWHQKLGTYWVRYIHVNLVSTSNIRVGDQVRVKSSVQTPKYEWGEVTHRSVGKVTGEASPCRWKRSPSPEGNVMNRRVTDSACFTRDIIKFYNTCGCRTFGALIHWKLNMPFHS